MLKKYRKNLIISTIVVLLPIAFGLIMWNKLPEVVTTHWGADGNPDGFGSKTFAVFGLPAILLGAHFVCLLFTLLDKKQKEQSRKALGIIFWFIPCTSLLANAVMYSAAFEKELEIASGVPALLGIILILFGNYLPKIKQNSTL